jgi:SAM-dependent methyltransferase
VSQTRQSYDAVASQYAERIAHELDHKPFDRELLSRFALQARPGPVWDVGCGPGHVSAFLAERGVEVVGVDLSPAMIVQARALHPALSFQEGDMYALSVEPGSLAGIVAFYSLIHIPRQDIPQVLEGFARALRPGGKLLLGWHLGTETLHVEELWGTAVCLDAYYFTAEEMAASCERAGLHVHEQHQREPYPDVEYPSRRGYLLAAKP